MKILKLLLITLLFEFILFVPKTFAATSPNLGNSADYSVIGKAGVTNTGNSVLSGKVGADISITGFLPGISAGQILAPAVNGAEADALTAYGELSQTITGILDLAGNNTVVPGVYDVAATTLNGTLTLNGEGVYIFRSTSSITTDTAVAKVVLINGARACDVFWQIPTSMSINSGATIIGTIIANSGSITFGEGASLNGRAFSLVGTVTLQNNSISGPTCATTAPANYSNSNWFPPAVCISTGVDANPRIIESTRISPTSIFIKWGPYEGMKDFIIEYGFENGKWLYNTTVNGFSTTINDLHINQPIWVRVAATDNCAAGNYSDAYFTGKPGSPNTGIGPENKNIFSIIFDYLHNFFLNQF